MTVYDFPDAELATTPAQAPLLGIKDRFGNQITLTRDSNSRLTRVTSPNGRWVEFTYDASSRITTARDSVNRTVGYEYDASGRLWTSPEPARPRRRPFGPLPSGGSGGPQALDSAHRMTTLKDPRGIVYLTNEYDLNGRVIRQTQADGSTYQFAYTLDGTGKVTQADVTDPRGYLRRVTFSSSGHWVTDTRAVGTPEQQPLTLERDPATNFITSATDALARRTEYDYDPKGNLIAIRRLADTLEPVETTATYEPAYQLLASVTDALQHTTTHAYTASGGLERITDPLGHSVTFTTNAAGQITSPTDSAGTIGFLYDNGDPSGIVDGAGQTTH